MGIRIYHGDSLRVLLKLEPDSLDGCVTDPPYELGFMGKSWDQSGISFDPKFWRLVYDCLKPGAYLAAFGGSRTSHRIACAIEDAGFEIRDTLMYLYGSGFPKSLDVSKALDKKLGAVREVVGKRPAPGYAKENVAQGAQGRTKYEFDRTSDEPASPEALKYAGYGTALKPAYEPILLCRKPLTVVPINDRLVAEVQNLVGGLLCLSLSNANNAKGVSLLMSGGSNEASVSALMLAAVLLGGESGELFAVTDTYNLRGTVSTCLSIATSWSGILDALCSRGSMFTTEITIRLTTALEILKSLISEIIPEPTVAAVSRPVGSQSVAAIAPAKESLNAENVSRRDIQSAFAAALVSLPRGESGTTAKNAERRLLPTIRSVDSVLSLALQQLTTENGIGFVPNVEPIILARRPLEGTVAQNVLKHGTGGLNIDGTRIRATQEDIDWMRRTARPNSAGQEHRGSVMNRPPNPTVNIRDEGRWPANIILDEEAAAMLDEQSGPRAGGGSIKNPPSKRLGSYGIYGKGDKRSPFPGYEDTGGASRFFYTAKASRIEREAGLTVEDSTRENVTGRKPGSAGQQHARSGMRREGSIKNTHPTVKPLSLMRWLVKLIMPPDGTLLEPFAGSGTTLVAAKLEGFGAVGIEKDQRSYEIACQSVKNARRKENPKEGVVRDRQEARLRDGIAFDFEDELMGDLDDA